MDLTLEEALTKGIEAHKAGRDQEAGKLYAAIIQAEPAHPDANHNMGLLGVGVGELEEAVTYFKVALEADSSKGQFWLSYIDALMRLGRSAEAQALFYQAKYKGIKSEVVDQLERRLADQGLNLNDTNTIKVDGSSSDKSNILDTIKLDKALRLAKQKSKDDQFEEAKNIYADILQKFPKNKQALTALQALAEAYFNIGNVMQDKGDLKAAIDVYKQALKINPEHADVFNNMGNAQKNKGDPEAAVISYKQALKIKPNNAGVYNNMGKALHDNGDLKAAIDTYKQAINIMPSNAEAYNNMGIALKDKGDSEAAIVSYKQAIKINPNHSGAYNNLGIAQNDKGDPESALDSYKQAIKINPGLAEAHNNIANILRDRGSLKSAIESYKNAIKIKPYYAEARMSLAGAEDRAVPQWHVSMMNDKQRNEAYLRALKLAIGKDDFVLEIGTGSGLLAMMAADSGAREVITCEASETIAKAAKKIIHKNGYSKKITVIDKKSTELIVGKDLPIKADVVISEVLSAEFVGEGVRSTIQDANKRLLNKNGKMIPESGDIRIALLGSNTEIQNKITVGNVNGYDLSDFNSIMSQKISLNLDDKPKLLSSANNAFHINLYDSQKIFKSEKKLRLTVTESGLCLGLIQWLKVQLFANIEYENKPGETASHWPTPIYLFDRPIEVTAGQVLEVSAVLFEDSVWFYHLE